MFLVFLLVTALLSVFRNMFRGTWCSSSVFRNTCGTHDKYPLSCWNMRNMFLEVLL